MKERASIWGWIGFTAVSVLGTLLHFLYDLWPNGFTAAISAVNESTFEHLKLAFFPMVLFAAVQYFLFGKNRQDFWCVKLYGIGLVILLIPTLFYTLSGVFGKLPAAVDVAIFYLSVGLAFFFETRRFSAPPRPCRSALALSILALMTFLFALFTFYPPQIGLFFDPVSGGFGR
ncbi:MAG: hypothetical protein IJC84_02780 [Clostridia bacterium]|nr:hypothetical protein [Clostridia bacterium]